MLEGSSCLVRCEPRLGAFKDRGADEESFCLTNNAGLVLKLLFVFLFEVQAFDPLGVCIMPLLIMVLQLVEFQR